MSTRTFKKNTMRRLEIEKRGEGAGTPLFDQKPIADKSLRAAVLPAHRRSVEVLTPTQRAALDAVVDKMDGQNLVVLMIFRDGGEFCYHDVVKLTGYKLNIVTRVLHTLRVKLSLIEVAGKWAGPEGVDVNYYRINRAGLDNIAAANPELA